MEESIPIIPIIFYSALKKRSSRGRVFNPALYSAFTNGNKRILKLPSSGNSNQIQMLLDAPISSCTSFCYQTYYMTF